MTHVSKRPFQKSYSHPFDVLLATRLYEPPLTVLFGACAVTIGASTVTETKIDLWGTFGIWVYNIILLYIMLGNAWDIPPQKPTFSRL